jgi:hypothetical protein
MTDLRTVRLMRRLGVFVTGASLALLSLPQSGHVQAAPAAARVNCSGYTAGMNVLATDVLRYIDTAGTLTPSEADAQAAGLRKELRTVLTANGKPVDNYKVVKLLVDAIVLTDAAVLERVPGNDASFQHQLSTVRSFYGNVQTLLREICLPSVIKHLPCSGKCVIDLVGTGRVRPFEDPRRGQVVTFVAPADSVLKYSWNCSAAFEKKLAFGLAVYNDGIPPDLTGKQLVPVVRRSGFQYRDTGEPNRVLLLLVAEQACQWHITVTKA